MRMMMAAAMAAALAGTAHAQETVYWSAPPAATPGRMAYFPMGTPIRLATRVDLSSKDNRPGDRFYLTVAEPLVFGGQTVVPAGALAVGEVVRVDRSEALGKRGRLAVRLLYAQTPGGPIALSGKADRAGKGQEVLAIGGSLLVWAPMILIHGTSARLRADTVVTAYLADDLRFPVAAPPPAAVADAAPGAPPARFDPSAFAGVRVAGR